MMTILITLITVILAVFISIWGLTLNVLINMINYWYIVVPVLLIALNWILRKKK